MAERKSGKTGKSSSKSGSRSGSRSAVAAAARGPLTYRGHRLRRIEDVIYYGEMSDKYIIMMQVLESREEQNLKCAARVSVQLQLTDPAVQEKNRVIRRSEKANLYSAMEIAAIWLDRALAGKEK